MRRDRARAGLACIMHERVGADDVDMYSRFPSETDSQSRVRQLARCAHWSGLVSVERETRFELLWIEFLAVTDFGNGAKVESREIRLNYSVAAVTCEYCVFLKQL